MWFYYVNNEKIGPITEDKLLNKFKNNELEYYTLIWKDGMTSWLPAHRVSTFKGILTLPEDFNAKKGISKQVILLSSLALILIISILMLSVLNIL
jgi:hypothetical protein